MSKQSRAKDEEGGIMRQMLPVSEGDVDLTRYVAIEATITYT